MNTSFIIPTFNEETNISDVISSIKTSLFNKSVSYEIIVVDNESTDLTRTIVGNIHNVKMLTSPRGWTVAQSRNYGARLSQGDILVFLDGDVILELDWGPAFLKILDAVEMTNLVTGSVCGIPEDATWVTKSWYLPILDKPRKYINSGHLIVSRKLFEEIDGFNKDLKTGEDSDFCRRAREAGAEIKNNPALKVIHLGYPRTLKEFFLREIWHGIGNFYPLENVFKSKASLTTIALLVALIWAIGMTIGKLSIVPLALYIFIVICLSFVFAIMRGGIKDSLKRTVIAFVWFAARVSSIFYIK